jgi:hypothetical protein
MRIIELNAGGWLTPLDFLNAVGRATGAPEGHGSDADAIVNTMSRGLNSVEPPYTIRIAGTTKLPSAVRKEIEALAQIIKDARLWRANHRHDDIEVVIEITP